METFSVFDGDRRIARGDLPTVAKAVGESSAPLLVMSDATGGVVDVDLRALHETSAATIRPRGRPKLGVTAREVTLLPRHWDWLATQPGGASAALRRLVDQARRDTAEADARRLIQEAAYRGATALAGDRPGYEDAIRALFANDLKTFEQLIAAWPTDIAAYLRDLTSPLNAPS